jgi:DNA polymerase III delta subunit
VDITALENELKAGKLNNIYLLYGEERFLLDNNVKKIKKLFGETVNGINYIQIDNTNVSEIIADIETPAFGYPQLASYLYFDIIFPFSILLHIC